MSFQRDSFQVLAFRIAALAAQSLAGLFVARLLGPEGQGEYALLLLIPGIGSQAFMFGMNVSNAWFVSRSMISRQLALSHSLYFSLLVGIVVLSLGVFFQDAFFDFSEPRHVAIMLAVIPLILFFKNLLGVLQGDQVFGAFGLLQFIRPALFGIFLLALFLFDSIQIESVVLIFLASHAFTLIFAFFNAMDGRVTLKFDFSLVKKQFRFAWKSYLAGTFAFLFYRIDLVFIGYFLDQKSVGYYAIIMLISESLLMLASSVGEVLFPTAARRPEEAPALVARVTRSVLAMTFLISAGLAIFAEQIVFYIFGPDYLPAVLALRIACFSILARAGTKIIANYILSVGKPGLNAMIAFVGLLLNAVLDILFIPGFDLVGAAMAAGASAFVMLCIKIIWLRKRTNCPLYLILVPQKTDFAFLTSEPGKQGCRRR